MEIAESGQEASEPACHPEPSLRRPDGLTLVAIYELVSAVLLLLLFSLFASYLVLALRAQPTGVVSVALDVALALALLGILFAVASAIVGWGLLRRRSWARTGGMLLAVPALLGLPVWTAFSILVLIYLHGDEAKRAVASDRESDPPREGPEPLGRDEA